MQKAFKLGQWLCLQGSGNGAAPMTTTTLTDVGVYHSTDDTKLYLTFKVYLDRKRFNNFHEAYLLCS